MGHIAEEEIRPDIRLEGNELIYTFGGEAWIDDDKFQEYGINFDKIFIHGIKPSQMVQLALVVVDHLLLCGHKFRIVETGEQDQRQKLLHCSED